MKQFEKLAIILVVLWILTVIPNRIIPMLLVRLMGVEQIGEFTALESCLIGARAVLGVALHMAISIWMFVQCTRDNAARWVWAVFGIFFGLSAPILYFLLKIGEETKRIRESQEIRQQESGA
jgi:hypothetical protein